MPALTLVEIFWMPPLFIFYVAKWEDILGSKRVDIAYSYMHIIFMTYTFLDHILLIFSDFRLLDI